MTIRKVFRLRRRAYRGIRGDLQQCQERPRKRQSRTKGGMMRGIKQGEERLVSRRLRDKNIKREDVAKHAKCCGHRMKT